MNISNIKKLLVEEKKIIIVDDEDVLVMMSFDEYEKIKNKNLEIVSALLDAKPELHVEQEAEKPTAELTLDDLPF